MNPRFDWIAKPQTVVLFCLLVVIYANASRFGFQEKEPTTEENSKFVPFTGTRIGFTEQPFHWDEGTGDGVDGATKEFYNRVASLAWENLFGDWRDREGVSQGSEPFATMFVKDTDELKVVQWDVTELVSQWLSGSANKGFYLRSNDRCKIDFRSRESDKPEQYPELVLLFDDESVVVKAVADTHLGYATKHSLGKEFVLRVSDKTPVLVRFPTEQFAGRRLKQAQLRMHSFAQYGSGDINVFACDQGEALPSKSFKAGIASQYLLDAGIDQSESVLFATGFETPNWKSEWSNHLRTQSIDIVSKDDELKFSNAFGKSLRVEIRKGKLSAMSSFFAFENQGFDEPEEIYFRYYLRLANDWNQTIQNGKLPGIAGTYGKAGWGGRKSDGSNGWSARGFFMQTIPKGNPLAGRTPIGTYCYHADMESPYGDGWVWSRNFLGYLARNHWYCIEHHLRLNTPGENDGLIEGWVDGQLAFQKNDIRFRDSELLKIENVWMDVYHGGTKSSPYDQHLFIDNVVIARDYIGPVGTHEVPAEVRSNE
ncbi:Disaggregatase related repeat protein [Rubripirellula obstinata]|uniref:Disaggregatase related repeat protein n=1 Tax=Rubripirellula obstinata TaxID=406547 RepID=A0A5B1CNR6_9BACT|nr:DNRLRE domain-containing protein [Rubripirellula obstinata]KAA1261003.1 Disaggregatase related repeat protein [Rubripirellula obstinata]